MYSNGKILIPTLAAILIFLYTLNPTVKIFGSSLPLSYIAVVLVVTPALLFYNNIKINHNLVLAILFLFLLAIYSLLIEYISTDSPVSMTFARLILSSIMYILFSISWVVLFRYEGVDKICLYIFLVAAFNSILICFMVTFPSLHVLIEGVLFQRESANIDYSAGWRMRGVAAGGGAALSGFMAIAIIMGMASVEARRLSSRAFLVGSAVILFSQIFVARTGLYIGVVLVFCWLGMQLLKGNVRVIVFTLVMSGLVAGISFAWFYDEIAVRSNWAFESVINFSKGEGFTSSTTDALHNMLFLPDDALRTLVGFGYFSGETPLRSDSGYMKTMFSVGVLGGVGLYATYLLIALLAFRYMGALSIYMFFIFLVLLLLEVKEPFVYQNYSSRAWILLAIVAILSAGNVKRVRENIE